MKTHAGKTYWIIGASSGIGAALAQDLSRQGANIIMSSRDIGKLAAVRAGMKGQHMLLPFDAADPDQMKKSADRIFEGGKTIDSVIYMAALYDPVAIEELDLEKLRAIVDVNIIGTFTAVQAILPHFKRQKHGQIALCGSVAGYRGLPKGQPYSATKAAVMNLAETLRCEMAGTGIDVKLISPGFVKTPLTDKNDFTMPMIITPEEAARHISRGLLTNKFEIRFPFLFTTIMKLVRVLPDWLYFRVFRLPS